LNGEACSCMQIRPIGREKFAEKPFLARKLAKSCGTFATFV